MTVFANITAMTVHPTHVRLEFQDKVGNREPELVASVVLLLADADALHEGLGKLLKRGDPTSLQ